MTTVRNRVATCLWFNGRGEEAAAFYVSLLPDSAMGPVFRAEPDAPATVIEFSLGGSAFMILDAGAPAPPTPAASIVVATRDQAETDELWSRLTANGGKAGRCGWLTDRYGVSWQILPEALLAIFRGDDRDAALRAHAAVMDMTKIDIAAIEAACAAG